MVARFPHRTQVPRLQGEAADAKTVRIPSDFQIRAYSGIASLGGDNLAFSSLLGQGKPVVLNFWDGLCPPCRAEMPDIQAVYHQFEGSVITSELLEA